MNSELIATLRKTFALVDKTTQVRAIGVLLVIILGVVLETVGIGLIFPFIQVIIDPGASGPITEVLRFFSIEIGPQENALLITLSVLILVLFVLKNVVLLLIYYLQTKFSMDNMRILALRMYAHYLRSPYALHLARNSSDLIQNIHAASAGTFVGSFMGFLTLFSEILLILALIVLMLTIDFRTTVAAGLILSAGVSAFYMIFRNQFRYWGERTLKVDKSVLKSLQQGLHSIKEVKILGRENFVLNDYRTPLNEFVSLIIIKQIMAQVPRLWVETLTVMTIIAVILYALSAGNSAASILPVLTVFAASTLRLIPSMSRIVISMNRINEAKHSVDVIYEDLFENELAQAPARRTEADTAPFTFRREIAVENVSFQYASSPSTALKDVSVSIPKGTSLGIVGESGAGKSTLVDLILGLLTPTSGSIEVDGRDISEMPQEWQRHVGYVPQSIYLIDDTLRRNIALGVEDDEIDEARVANALRMARLDDFVAGLPEGLDTAVNEHGVRLSGGQRQRVGIARALYNEPDVIILDEATSALDSATEREVNKAIEALSSEKTLIIIAHRLSTVRGCDQLIFLDGGRLQGRGSFDQLTASNPKFRNLAKLAEL